MAVTVRDMIRTRRNEMPRWEVSQDGRVIGWVEAHRIGHASATFYKAYGISDAPVEVQVSMTNSEWDSGAERGRIHDTAAGACLTDIVQVMVTELAVGV